MTGAPDPGKGFRLVDNAKEFPHPEADVDINGRWMRRGDTTIGYVHGCNYRVPNSKPAPEPVPLRWPDIPVSDDAWFQQPEPDSGADVATWVMSAVMAVVLLLTGFILGWSWGG